MTRLAPRPPRPASAGSLPRPLHWGALGLAAIVAVTLLALAPPVAADQVVTIERHAESWSSGGDLVLSGTEEGTLYLGTGKARFDQGKDSSWILRPDLGELVFLDHAASTFFVVPLPVRLEDFYDAAEIAKLHKAESVLAPRLETVVGAEHRPVDGYSAWRVTLKGKPPEGKTRFDYELWMTGDLPVDRQLYGNLVRSFGALDLTYRAVARTMAGLDGFPVARRSVVTHSGGAREIDVRRVTGFEERPVADDLYAPPANYRRVPFDPSDRIDLHGDPDRPPASPGPRSGAARPGPRRRTDSR